MPEHETDPMDKQEREYEELRAAGVHLMANSATIIISGDSTGEPEEGLADDGTLREIDRDDGNKATDRKSEKPEQEAKTGGNESGSL